MELVLVLPGKNHTGRRNMDELWDSVPMATCENTLSSSDIDLVKGNGVPPRRRERADVEDRLYPVARRDHALTVPQITANSLGSCGKQWGNPREVAAQQTHLPASLQGHPCQRTADKSRSPRDKHRSARRHLPYSTQRTTA